MSKQIKIVRGQWCTHPNGPQWFPTPPYPNNPEQDLDPTDPDALKALIETLKDVDGQVFFPRTHFDAVINNKQVTLTQVLKQLSDRLADCEGKFDPDKTPIIKIANNFLVDSAAAALSAGKGKWLYDAVNDSEEFEFVDDKLHLKDDKILSSISDKAISEPKLDDGSVSRRCLDSELSESLEQVDSITAMQEQLNELMEQSLRMQEKYNDLYDQNQSLLKLHHQHKETTVKCILTDRTGATHENPTRINLSDYTASGIPCQLSWDFVDTKEIDDAQAESGEFYLEYSNGTRIDLTFNNLNRSVNHTIQNVGNCSWVKLKVKLRFSYIDFAAEHIINLY